MSRRVIIVSGKRSSGKTFLCTRLALSHTTVSVSDTIKRAYGMLPAAVLTLEQRLSLIQFRTEREQQHGTGYWMQETLRTVPTSITQLIVTDVRYRSDYAYLIRRPEVQSVFHVRLRTSDDCRTRRGWISSSVDTSPSEVDLETVPVDLDCLPDTVETVLEQIRVWLTASVLQQLTVPFVYTATAPQGNFRERLVSDLCRTYAIPDLLRCEIIHLVSVLHDTSLMVDDIQDRSLVRRGMPCAYIQYGVNETLNAAYRTMFKVVWAARPEFQTVLLECCMKLHEGQHLDLLVSSPSYAATTTLETYEYMVGLKTGALVVLIGRLIQLARGPMAVLDLHSEVLLRLGAVFQKHNDLSDFTSQRYEDISLRKLSFVVLNSMQHERVHAYFVEQCEVPVEEIVRLCTESLPIVIRHLRDEITYIVNILPELRTTLEANVCLPTIV
jgi:phosphomevalonate kinase